MQNVQGNSLHYQNEHFGSIKEREFRDKLSDYQFSRTLLHVINEMKI